MNLTDRDAVNGLLTPEAVRERCLDILKIAKEGKLYHFELHQNKFDLVIKLVLEEISSNYPEGNIPIHSRWRHFEFDSQNLWAESFRTIKNFTASEVARRRIDLAFVSVLLDAGAGIKWRYSDKKTGISSGRSEGLAIASIRLVESGLLSANGKDDPFRVDACALEGLTKEELGLAFQVTKSNSLVGLEERSNILNQLGKAVRTQTEFFSYNGTLRPGNIFDFLASKQKNGMLGAPDILVAILQAIGGIWPDGLQIAGIPVGDVGYHEGVVREDITNGILPFHKLSQWLAYSLIEPLEEAGIKIINLDGLTGLAEYRNGGLLIDTKLLTLKNAGQVTRLHDPKSSLVTEWRGLTVALLDEIALRVRGETGKNPENLPLSSILQGGTWSAGRNIAKTLRKDGRPPLLLNSKGTLF